MRSAGRRRRLLRESAATAGSEVRDVSTALDMTKEPQAQVADEIRRAVQAFIAHTRGTGIYNDEIRMTNDEGMTKPQWT